MMNNYNVIIKMGHSHLLAHGFSLFGTRSSLFYIYKISFWFDHDTPLLITYLHLFLSLSTTSLSSSTHKWWSSQKSLKLNSYQNGRRPSLTTGSSRSRLRESNSLDFPTNPTTMSNHTLLSPFSIPFASFSITSLTPSRIPTRETSASFR